jgi:hypothetical protein
VLETVDGRSYTVDAAGNHDYLELEGDTVTLTYSDSGHVSGLTTGSGQTEFTRDYRGQRIDYAGPSGGGIAKKCCKGRLGPDATWGAWGWNSDPQPSAYGD